MPVQENMEVIRTARALMRRTRRALPLALALALVACGGSDSKSPVGPPTPPATVCTPGNGTVCMTKSNTFDPVTMTVAVGSTVTWMNTTGVSHNVTFDSPGSPANVPSFASGAQNVTFLSKGTFAYHCTIHGTSMSGTITVQ